jgi:hypothetical protein
VSVVSSYSSRTAASFHDENDEKHYDVPALIGLFHVINSSNPGSEWKLSVQTNCGARVLSSLSLSVDSTCARWQEGRPSHRQHLTFIGNLADLGEIILIEV